MFPLLVLLGVGGFVLFKWNAPAGKPGTPEHAHAKAQAQGQQQAQQIAQAASTGNAAFLAAAARNAARGFDVHVPTPNQVPSSPMPRTYTQASLVATYSPTAVAPLTAAYSPTAPAPPTGFSPASTTATVNRPASAPSPASQIFTAASPLLGTLAGQAGISSGLTAQALGLGAAAAGGASPNALLGNLATDVTANAMAAASSYQTGDASTVPPLPDGTD